MHYRSIIIDLMENFRGMQRMRDQYHLQLIELKSKSKNEKIQNPSNSKSGINELEHSVNTLKNKLWMQQISFIKLLCDFTFNWVDVMQLSGTRADGIQAFSGFLSGILATYKLLVKCR